MWIELVSDVELFKRRCKNMQPNVACIEGQGWAGACIIRISMLNLVLIIVCMH